MWVVILISQDGDFSWLYVAHLNSFLVVQLFISLTCWFTGGHVTSFGQWNMTRSVMLLRKEKSPRAATWFTVFSFPSAKRLSMFQMDITSSLWISESIGHGAKPWLTKIITFFLYATEPSGSFFFYQGHFLLCHT